MYMKGHALCDAPFAGLLVRGPVNDQGVVSSYAQLNASMHSVAELEKATHINELREWDEGMYAAALPPAAPERETSYTPAWSGQLRASMCTGTTSTWASGATTHGSRTWSTPSTSSTPRDPSTLNSACAPSCLGKPRSQRPSRVSRALLG